jgi:hypothetical protein
MQQQRNTSKSNSIDVCNYNINIYRYFVNFANNGGDRQYFLKKIGRYFSLLIANMADPFLSQIVLWYTGLVSSRAILPAKKQPNQHPLK